MEKTTIKEKIQELENWLLENPNSPERSLIDSDIKKFESIRKKS